MPVLPDMDLYGDELGNLSLIPRRIRGIAYRGRQRSMVPARKLLYMPYTPLGEYDEYGLGSPGLFKKFKKVLRKVVKKVPRVVGAAVVGFAMGGPAGAIAAGGAAAFSGRKKGTKWYQDVLKGGVKFGATVGSAVGVIAGTGLASTAVKTLAEKASAFKMRSVVTKLGKVINMSPKIASKLASKGIDPDTATPEQVITAGEEVGEFTPQMEQQFLQTQAPEISQAIAQQIQRVQALPPEQLQSVMQTYAPADMSQAYEEAYAPKQIPAGAPLPSWLIPVGIGAIILIIGMGGKK